MIRWRWVRFVGRPAMAVVCAYGSLVSVAVVAPSVTGYIGSASAAAPPGTVTACNPIGDFPLSAGTYDDVDGDGRPDVVAGVPSVTTASPGTVDVHDTRRATHNIVGARWPQLGISARFGSAIAEVDVDSDGCSDLAVGDPGHAGGGAVDLLFGTQNGVRTTSPVQIPARTSSDDYGTAVSVGRSTRGKKSVTDLWIGAPGRTVDGSADAGAIDHYTLSATGAVTFVQSLTESSAVIGGKAQAHERFGAVIDADADAVLVGLPAATVRGRADAGAAVWLVVGGSGAVSSSQTWTQDSPGVPGASESGDRFGASVVAEAHVIAVGVPDEDLGAISNAGLVQTFVRAASGLLRAGAEISQSTPGVPGASEKDDYFGWALAGTDLGAARALWIGVPGEDLGGQADAGDVTEVLSVTTGSSTTVTYALLRQGPGGTLAGTYSAGNEVGHALGETTAQYIGDDQNYFEGVVVIGAPGVTVGGIPHAGQILTAFYDTGHLAVQGDGAVMFSGTAVPDQRYGSVIAQPVDQSVFQ